ncbi:MAG: hypothetical protein VYC64_03690 [Candidatus Latescibacterota bacterium]|nr:hypothetical protein [Candidatus Latescibacterota bacterium]
MHRKRFTSLRQYSLAGLCVLLAGFPSQDLSPAAASSGQVRVLYLLHPDMPAQVARLQQLLDRASVDESVDVVGISRICPVPETVRALPADVFVRDVRVDVSTRRWVAARLQNAGDALRVEGPDAVFTSDRKSIDVTMAHAGLALLATDIDFSTWGKVKDLFR